MAAKGKTVVVPGAVQGHRQRTGRQCRRVVRYMMFEVVIFVAPLFVMDKRGVSQLLYCRKKYNSHGRCAAPVVDSIVSCKAIESVVEAAAKPPDGSSAPVFHGNKKRNIRVARERWIMRMHHIQCEKETPISVRNCARRLAMRRGSRIASHRDIIM